MFDELQTFRITSSSAGNAPEVLATSVYLYFKRKAHINKNRSGIVEPGVTVQLIECEGEIPNPSKPVGQPVRVEYDDIYALRDASSPTIFAFTNPVPLFTDRFYAIAIQYDDRGFKIWRNEQGQKLIGTNTNSSGSSRARDGAYYKAIHGHYDHYWKQILDNAINGNDSHISDKKDDDVQYKAFKDRDLKFAVNIAKFNTQPGGGGGGFGNTSVATTINLVNGNYEFFTINAVSGVFNGGEYVFANNALATGTISVSQSNTTVIGTGTTFTTFLTGDPIVITSGNTNYIGVVNSVSNNTVLIIKKAPAFTNTVATFRAGITAQIVQVDYVKQKMILKGSSASNGAVFAAGQLIRGGISNSYATIQTLDNLKVDRFVPHLLLGAEIAANTAVTYDMAHANGASFAFDSSFKPITDNQEVNIATMPGLILSRSTEIAQTTLFGTTKKSAVIKIAIASSNSAHAAPHVNTSDADIITGGYSISNTYLLQAANGMYYDSETNNHGAALSKHISKHFTFGKSQLAEDLRVFIVANKPIGTELRVYAKVHNEIDSDTFDDKRWTRMNCIDNANTYSSTTDLSDLVQYEYAIPASPESESTAAGLFTTTNASAVVTGTSGTVATNLPVGRLVKIYSSYFADNYLVGKVISANTTTFTLDNPITDANVLGSGFKVDLLANTQTAFKNVQNSKIIRYYNMAGSTIDNFNSMQIKIVQLANVSNIIPRIRQYEAIGVSA